MNGEWRKFVMQDLSAMKLSLCVLITNGVLTNWRSLIPATGVLFCASWPGPSYQSEDQHVLVMARMRFGIQVQVSLIPWILPSIKSRQQHLPDRISFVWSFYQILWIKKKKKTTCTQGSRFPISPAILVNSPDLRVWFVAHLMDREAWQTAQSMGSQRVGLQLST